MPAILRNSLPNRVASTLYSQSYAPIGVGEGSRPWSPPLCMVLAACGSATLCHVVGGSTIRCFAPPPYSLGSLWPSVLDAVRFPDSVPAVTNAYRIPCSLCETGWCFWFGPPATYHRLPHGTCTTHWILVWSSAALPVVTMRYHARLLSRSTGS